MKRKLKFVVIYGMLLIPVAIASFVWGCLYGRERTRIEDFRLYDAILRECQRSPEARSVPLQEFLKGRYYYLANTIPEDWLGSPCDYGPVNSTLLSVSKDPSSPQEEYQRFKRNNVRFGTPTTQPST